MSWHQLLEEINDLYKWENLLKIHCHWPCKQLSQNIVFSEKGQKAECCFLRNVVSVHFCSSFLFGVFQLAIIALRPKLSQLALISSLVYHHQAAVCKNKSPWSSLQSTGSAPDSRQTQQSVGEQSEIFSSWRARYSSQELIESKTKVKKT